MESVLRKLRKGKVTEVRDAARKKLSKNRDDPEGWFLLGMVSQHKGSHEYALECFERALYLKKTGKYHKAKGIAHMSSFEFERAVKDLKKALVLSNDAETHFMLAVALMFINDSAYTEHMKAAYTLDSKKTKTLLQNFFDAFFRDDPSIPAKEKEAVLRKLQSA